jgi:DNA-binding FadR family transcriptional regulator
MSASPGSPHPEISRTRGEKVSRTVARLIVREIASKHLAPGSLLAPEHIMAQRYGVGHPAIREALRLLEAQGLIVIRPGREGGPVVGSPTGADFAQTMTMFLQVAGTKVRELNDAVATMEAGTAALAARRVADGTYDAELLEAVKKASRDDLLRYETDDDFIPHGVAFHDAIRELAGNQILGLVQESVGHLFSERAGGADGRHFNPEHRMETAKAHNQIARAINNGNVPRAHRLAFEHMVAEARYVASIYPGVLDEVIDWR